MHISANQDLYLDPGAMFSTELLTPQEKLNYLSCFTFSDFDGTGGPDNIGFIIKKIKVWTDPTVAGYKYDGNFAVDYFLDLHSDDNYNDYCLSYLFTYRDFSDGVLGLAWLGDVGSAGGVCEIYRVRISPPWVYETILLSVIICLLK